WLFWKSHFASDPSVIGKVLELNQHRYTVIGVVGPRFTWHDSEVYLPIAAGTDPSVATRRLCGSNRVLDRGRHG
ncbi:MAG: hypothetical protein WA869_26230, partial [Alloacidobacterium sp.]